MPTRYDKEFKQNIINLYKQVGTLFNLGFGSRSRFPLIDGNGVDIQFLHEPGNPSWAAPTLQWLKFQHELTDI